MFFISISVFRSDDPAKALQAKEARQISLDDAAKSSSELEHERALKGLITVEGAVDVATTSVSFTKMLKILGMGSLIFFPEILCNS